MNINTDIDDFHIFFPLRLMGLGDSQNRKMAIQQTVRNAHFSGVWPHRMCLLISKSLRYGKHRFSASVHTLAVLALTLQSQSQTRSSVNFARTRTLFSLGILTRTHIPDILKSTK